jgi:tetratricopeptide (TPR) repeat protein
MQKYFICFFVTIFSFQAFSITLDDYTIVYDSYKLEASGKIPQAIEKMTQIFSKSSDHYLVNYRLGWLFSLDKKYQNSADHYKKAAKKNPSSIEPWLALSSLYLNLGEWKNASDSSNEIILRDKNNYYGNLRFIQANLKLRDFESALEKVTTILKVYPLDTLFLEQKAYILAELNKNKEAKNAALDLLLVSPNNQFAKNFMKKNK